MTKNEKFNWELPQQTQPCRRVSDLEDRTFEIIQPEEQKGKIWSVKKSYNI